MVGYAIVLASGELEKLQAVSNIRSVATASDRLMSSETIKLSEEMGENAKELNQILKKIIYIKKPDPWII